jgi:hypothetical protein
VGNTCITYIDDINIEMDFLVQNYLGIKKQVEGGGSIETPLCYELGYILGILGPMEPPTQIDDNDNEYKEMELIARSWGITWTGTTSYEGNQSRVGFVF